MTKNKKRKYGNVKAIESSYGKASCRLNELYDHIPFAKKEFEVLINSIASWQNCYTLQMEEDLMSDLKKLQDKWTDKAATMAGWFD